jgi:hypothetical protein
MTNGMAGMSFVMPAPGGHPEFDSILEAGAEDIVNYSFSMQQL